MRALPFTMTSILFCFTVAFTINWVGVSCNDQTRVMKHYRLELRFSNGSKDTISINSSQEPNLNSYNQVRYYDESDVDHTMASDVVLIKILE